MVRGSLYSLLKSDSAKPHGRKARRGTGNFGRTDCEIVDRSQAFQILGVSGEGEWQLNITRYRRNR